jgi:hypothetical protein
MNLKISLLGNKNENEAHIIKLELNLGLCKKVRKELRRIYLERSLVLITRLANIKTIIFIT